MSAAELRDALVRASRRRNVVKLRVGGASTIEGTIGFVGEREILVIDRRSLRITRVFIGAIEGVS